MDFTNTNFNFYTIDQGDQEKLIRMWKHFNPKDNPEPLNEHVITINKNTKANNYELLFNLLYPVFKKLSPADCFIRTCIHLRMKKPVDYMYEYFIDKHTEKKEVIKEITNEEVKPKRKKKETS